MAKEGRTAIEEVFPALKKLRDERNTVTISDSMKLLTQSRNRVIEVLCDEEFCLPWELLYVGNVDSDSVQPWDFLGMRHAIGRLVQRKDHTPMPDFKGPIECDSKPRVGLFGNSQLSCFEEMHGSKGIRFLAGLDSARRISLVRCPALDPQKEHRGQLNVFRGFWAKGLHIADFECHGFYGGDGDCKVILLGGMEHAPQEEAYIEIDSDFAIGVSDLGAYPPKKRTFRSPLVILNACCSGMVGAFKGISFARKFLELGACGVVSTECAVPDQFAVEFIEKFYEALLGGNTLSDSLLLARRHSLLVKHNPSGLLYAIYANPDTTIVRR